jgi:adenylate kinase family enzyme
MPPAVKDKDKLNIILYGPEKAGKTSVANFLSQEHQRCIVKLD